MYFNCKNSTFYNSLINSVIVLYYIIAIWMCRDIKKVTFLQFVFYTTLLLLNLTRECGCCMWGQDTLGGAYHFSTFFRGQCFPCRDTLTWDYKYQFHNMRICLAWGVWDEEYSACNPELRFKKSFWTGESTDLVSVKPT